jgi:hypothetical protein
VIQKGSDRNDPALWSAPRSGCAKGRPAATGAWAERKAHLATIDLAASSALTRQQLGWNTSGPDLLVDLRNMDYNSFG